MPESGPITIIWGAEYNSVAKRILAKIIRVLTGKTLENCEKSEKCKIEMFWLPRAPWGRTCLYNNIDEYYSSFPYPVVVLPRSCFIDPVMSRSIVSFVLAYKYLCRVDAGDPPPDWNEPLPFGMYLCDPGFEDYDQGKLLKANELINHYKNVGEKNHVRSWKAKEAVIWDLCQLSLRQYSGLGFTKMMIQTLTSLLVLYCVKFSLSKWYQYQQKPKSYTWNVLIP